MTTMRQSARAKANSNAACARAMGVHPATFKRWLRQQALPMHVLSWSGAIPNLPTRPDATIEHEERQRVIQQQLKTLTAREQHVLTLRYGLDGTTPKTQTLVGSLLGVSGTRIGQIESIALRKLRHPRRADSLREVA